MGGAQGEKMKLTGKGEVAKCGLYIHWNRQRLAATLLDQMHQDDRAGEQRSRLLIITECALWGM